MVNNRGVVGDRSMMMIVMTPVDYFYNDRFRVINITVTSITITVVFMSFRYFNYLSMVVSVCICP